MLHFELLTRWLNFYFFASQSLTEVKKQKNSLRVTNSMGALLFSSSYELEVNKLKKLLKYYSLRVCEPLEMNTSP